MKKTHFGSVCMASIMLMSACTKNDSTTGSSTKQVVIDTTITSGSTLSISLNSFGSKAVIMKQPSSFTTSSILQGSRSTGLVYQYSNNAKTTTTEQVLLAVTSDSKHNCKHESSDSTIVTIQLKVQ